MIARLSAPFRQFTVWLLVGLLAWVSILGEGFWSVGNLQNLVVAVSIEGVMVVGMTILMIGGGFDLSIGSVMALAGVIVVKSLALGLYGGIFIAVAAAGIVGIANGL